jgi:hypothetical protein
MKKIMLLALVTLFLGAQNSFAVVGFPNLPVSQISQNPDVKALPADLAATQMEQFMSLTPAKYKEMTGKKLGWKNSLALRMAQKSLKKEMAGGGSGSSDIPKGLYIVAVIFGWGWLCMGLMDNWEGKNWWVNLLLVYLTCGIGGLIHGLIKMKDYYK